MRSSSIHGASRPYAVVTIACVLSFGCISESREGVDADAADVVETLDTGIDEVEAKDTEEAETLRVECDIDAGCSISDSTAPRLTARLNSLVNSANRLPAARSPLISNDIIAPNCPPICRRAKSWPGCPGNPG